MKSSKLLLTSLLAAATMSVSAYADLTTVADMSTLVEAGNVGDDVTNLTSKYVSGNTVYDFGGTNGITGITTAGLSSLMEQTSGYITVAAWVRHTGYTSGEKDSFFSYGAQSDGFKLNISASDKLSVTTKGLTDVGEGGSVTFSEWTLVAISLNLAKSGDSRYLIGGESDFYTRQVGGWTDPARTDRVFGIGTGNGTGDREVFTGQIANLTIFSSDTLATNADVVAKMGTSAPTLDYFIWNGNSGEWNKSSTSWTKQSDTSTSVMFASGGSAKFATADATITLGESITAHEILVAENTTFVSANDKMLSAAALTVDAGKTLTLDGGISNYTFSSFFGTGAVRVTDASVDSAGFAKVSAFTGTVKFDGAVNLGSDVLTVSSGTREFLGGLTAGGVSVSGGTTNFSGTGAVTVTGIIETKNGAVVNQTNGVANAQRLVLHNSAANGADTYNLSGGVLNITSTSTVADNTAAVLVGHWASGSGALNLSGTGVLNVAEGGVSASHTSPGSISISGDSELNAYVLHLKSQGSSSAVTVSGNGRLNLGAGGFDNTSATNVLTFDGGTLGTFADAFSSSGAVSLGANGIIVDTEKRTLSTTGASSASGAAASITLNGVLSDAADATGSLTKRGTGTLTLGGENTYSGATKVEAGTLVAGNARALGEGAVTLKDGATLKRGIDGTVNVGDAFTTEGAAILDLGTLGADTAAITATGAVTISSGTIFDMTEATAGLKLVSGSSVTASGLGIANVYVGGYLANQRGSSATFTVTENTLVLSTYEAGEAWNITWDGGDSGVWKANGSGWTKDADGSTAANFQNGDSVTFGTGTTNAATLEGSLKVGTLTISDATTLSVADGSTASVATGTLSLGANLTLNGGVTLAVTTFASSIIEVDSTVDYSNLSGTGTLSLGLRNDNGVGFNLSNFEGTIRVERGTGVTAASRFQLNTSTLNANARIVVADGNDLVFSDDTNKNVSNSVTFEGSGTIHVNGNNDFTEGNNVCTGTLSGNVTSAGTLTKNGDGTLTLSGTSNISALTIIKGTIVYSAGTHTVGSISASEKALTVNGGSLTISGAAASTIGTLAVNGAVGVGGASKTTITTLSGTGTLTKAGSGTLFIKGSNTNAFHGTLVVESGVVMMGQDDNSRSNSSLTDSAHGAKIFVKSGATFTTHMGSADAASPNTFNGDFYIASGATLGNKDGHVKLAGNIVFGATDTEGNFDSNATVTYAQYWRKAVEFAGAISGAGMVTLQNATAEDGTAYYKISGSDNTFAGTYKLTGAANRLVKFQLTNETAAQNASVNLSTQYASMELGAGAVRIAGLEGVSGSSVTRLSGTAASTLTVNQTANTTFAGTIADGIALKKAGAGTLTLAGASTAFNGSVKVSGGVLALADASAIGSGNAVRIDGGQLKVGNGTTAVSLNAAAYTIVLSDAYSEGSGVAAIVGTDATNKSSVALATDTKITIELADSVAVSLAAEAAQYHYKIFDTATIDDASFTIGSFALSEALKSDWRISDYTDGVLTISAIPEPSTFGLLAGLGALALAGTRRRRKKA